MPFAALAQTADISGMYSVHGMNADGSTYQGSAEITEVLGQVAVSWNVAGETYGGKGARAGRVVTVDWGVAAPVIYVVMPSGELHGTWNGGKALERLVPK